MDLFPFPKIRNGQKEFLSDVRDVLFEGKNLIAHAPTGIGKTVASLSPSLEYALENKKTVIFLTPKQSQHKIAVETLKLIKNTSKTDFVVIDVISKQDMCPRSVSKERYAFFNEFCKIEQKTKNCSYFRRHDVEVVNKISENVLHVEELCNICVKNGVCPHRTALDVGENADIIICDYNYIFSKISETILPRIKKSLENLIIIVDEAHNLPERIRNQLSDILTQNDLSEASSEIRTIEPTLYRHLNDFSGVFKSLIKKTPKNSEIRVERDSIIKEVEKILKSRFNPISYEEFVDDLRTVSVESEAWHAMEVSEFLDGWATKERCSRIFTNSDFPNLSYKLLDPSILSEKIISNAHSTIMMSGTLYPMEMYSEVLGANPNRTLLKEYESPFPKENRLIMVTEELTTRYRERGQLMYERIAYKISKIFNEIDEINGNAAVFFPSYALMQSIISELPLKMKRRILIEKRNMSKAEKNGLYKILMDSGGFLFGVQAGSLSEGFDYEDNILTAVIVVGVPLGPPTLDVKNLVGYYVNKFGREKGNCYGYLYPAMSRALQAAGRGIRSESDIGIIVFMDYRFQFRPYSDCFPSDYNVMLTDESEKLCAKFLKHHLIH